MKKQKLIMHRQEKGFSQYEMAMNMNMEQSQYCRRENGTVQISKKQWESLTKILDVRLEEIYEPHDGVYISNNENVNGSVRNLDNYCTHLELAMETMKKYIEKLEKEIDHLTINKKRSQK